MIGYVIINPHKLDFTACIRLSCIIAFMAKICIFSYVEVCGRLLRKHPSKVTYGVSYSKSELFGK